MYGRPLTSQQLVRRLQFPLSSVVIKWEHSAAQAYGRRERLGDDSFYCMYKSVESRGEVILLPFKSLIFPIMYCVSETPRQNEDDPKIMQYIPPLILPRRWYFSSWFLNFWCFPVFALCLLCLYQQLVFIFCIYSYHIHPVDIQWLEPLFSAFPDISSLEILPRRNVFFFF